MNTHIRCHRPILASLVAAGAFALLAAGCGGSNGSGSTSKQDSYSSAVAYTHCMRTHGLHDFPDPTANPGGGVAFEINGEPGSDLSRTNPTFQRASQACRTLQPGGQQLKSASPGKIAVEVRWARCIRSHGVPSFPDPNSQGAFDSSKFNESTPAFQAASSACKHLEAAMGAVSVVPGHG